MYPLSNLKQIKDENLQQELAELQNKITELERYHNFLEVNELLEESKITLANEKNVGLIAEYSKKIDSLITSLTQPIQEKVNQLTFLMNLNEYYCDPSEVQELNSTLVIQEKKLKAKMAKDSIDPKEIENHLSQVGSVFHRNLKKILEKIKQSLIEKVRDARYENYLTSQVALLSQSEKEINEKSTEISACFDTIKVVIESISEFETNHDYFINLIENFNQAEDYFNKLTNTLLNSDTIKICTDEIACQIKSLSKEFAEFDPRVKLTDTLNSGLQGLCKKLNQLYQLNHEELHSQQIELIRLVNISKQKLIVHADKLSQSNTKCSMNKYQAIELIKEKIDLLLNTEINQEDNASSEKMTDTIFALKQTINEAKDVLSKYRGISLLRCFATLWGGGKVTSQLLVNKLEEQLTDLQSNINVISPRI